jgi:Cu/Ag efflux pump CusA
MIGKLTSYVLSNRATVLAGLIMFVFFGVVAFRELPVEAYPDVTNVTVQIITLYPGHAAEEVERQVTIPIENVMNGIPLRVSMRSISLFGLSHFRPARLARRPSVDGSTPSSASPIVTLSSTALPTRPSRRCLG